MFTPEKIDIKGGKLTFSNRIELGKIFETAKEGDEMTVIRAVAKCLHNIDLGAIDAVNIKFWVQYFDEICDGLKYWIEAEQRMLKYTPSIDEQNAGIMELSQRIGYMGTIKSLATRHGKSPDEVLEWEYGTVFGILYADLEESKFKDRYRKIIESKSKR